MNIADILYIVVIGIVCFCGLRELYKGERFKDGGTVPGIKPLPSPTFRSKIIKYNIRLTIKAIIRAEQMLKKPFPEIDYTNPDELLKLLYCTVLANNKISFTYEEFKLIAENEKQFSAMIKEIEKANTVLAQFSTVNEENNGSGSTEPGYVKDIIGTLVMSGLSAHYVMDEMEISDIPVFIDAYEKIKRENMESSRLWTFLSILPHVDTKAVKSAQDLILFPWEAEEENQKAKEAIERDRDIAERFFSGEFNPLKNN